MKAMCVIALTWVGLDCVEKAIGSEPQMIFSDGMTWLWWIPAAAWFATAYGMLFKRIE